MTEKYSQEEAFDSDEEGVAKAGFPYRDQYKAMTLLELIWFELLNFRNRTNNSRGEKPLYPWLMTIVNHDFSWN